MTVSPLETHTPDDDQPEPVESIISENPFTPEARERAVAELTEKRKIAAAAAVEIVSKYPQARQLTATDQDGAQINAWVIQTGRFGSPKGLVVAEGVGVFVVDSVLGSEEMSGDLTSLVKDGDLISKIQERTQYEAFQIPKSAAETRSNGLAGSIIPGVTYAFTEQPSQRQYSNAVNIRVTSDIIDPRYVKPALDHAAELYDDMNKPTTNPFNTETN